MRIVTLLKIFHPFPRIFSGSVPTSYRFNSITLKGPCPNAFNVLPSTFTWLRHQRQGRIVNAWPIGSSQKLLKILKNVEITYLRTVVHQLSIFICPSQLSTTLSAENM
jgi:hypothetical protein